MENINFFWKNKYGKSDLNIIETIIRNVEFSLLRIKKNHKNLCIFWNAVTAANEMSEELLKTGHIKISE
jgi:hypothetical protein